MPSVRRASAGDRTIPRPASCHTSRWCGSRGALRTRSMLRRERQCSTPPRATCGSRAADMAAGIGLDRQQVIEEAAALADESGADAVTLAALAARLGVRSQSLYAHVDGLEGLRRDLAVLGQRSLAEQLGRAVMGRAGEDGLRALCD